MKYFSFNEFERSQAAYKYGLDNSIPAALKNNIAALVDNVLDPLREAWGKPITVTSGYRSQTVNKLVGGVATSHHLKGMAADITAGGTIENRKLYDLVQKLNLPYTQLIGNRYDFKWLHIGYDPNDKRHEAF